MQFYSFLIPKEAKYVGKTRVPNALILETPICLIDVFTIIGRLTYERGARVNSKILLLIDPFAAFGCLLKQMIFDRRKNSNNNI